MKKTFKIGGMTCAACSSRVERFVKRVDGISSAAVNLPLETLTVDFDTARTSAEAVEAAVIRAGYTVIHQNEPAISPEEHLAGLKKRLQLSLLFLLPLILLAMAPMISGHLLPKAVNPLLFPLRFAVLELLLTLPLLYLGRSFYRTGLPALLHLSPDMNSLIAVGTIASFSYSLFSLCRIASGEPAAVRELYFDSAASILTLVTLGKYLEAKAKGKTTAALRSLLALSPKTARVERNGREEEIPAEDIRQNDIILVKPGEALPSDGIIISGTAVLNEAMLTGESLPVTKESGERVYGATVNTTGFFRYRADSTGDESALQRIVRLIEEAQTTKAPVARAADAVAAWFVPLVLSLALLAAVFWWLNGAAPSFILKIFVSVLVVACPCALGLATPTAIMVASGKAAENGILFKSGEALELLQKADTMILDKTGTLTSGRLTVTDICPVSLPADRLLSLAAAIEQGSEHPIAKAILEKAAKNQPCSGQLQDFTPFPGFGASAVIDGKNLKIGRISWLEKQGCPVPDNLRQKAGELELQGKTTVLIAQDSEPLGLIALADTLKPEAAEAINRLRTLGITPLLFTGDNPRTAEAIARQAGINQFKAEMLPGTKSAGIQQLRAAGKITAMVGDGINDAPALTAADLGIAIGSGTDIAIESADIVLMHSDLRDIAGAIAISRRTMRTIRQNLGWAFGYNLLGLPAAMGVLHLFGGPLLNPMLCAAAMSLSSLSVVTNALRLKQFKLPLPSDDNNNNIQAASKQKEGKRMIITIEGMMCQHCVKHVKDALEKISGAADVTVDLESGKASLTGNIDAEAVRNAIEDAGYNVTAIEA